MRSSNEARLESCRPAAGSTVVRTQHQPKVGARRTRRGTPKRQVEQRSTLSLQELDKRLDRLAAKPDRFAKAVAKFIAECDRLQLDLEIRDPIAWRKSGEFGTTKPNFLNQFRADVDNILSMDRLEEARHARRIEFARARLQVALENAGLPKDLAIEGVGLNTSSLAIHGDLDQTPELPRSVVRRQIELHALRTEMVERNLYLVLINVERYTHTGASRVDLIQEGCVSLFRAVDGFDWRRGLLFRTYAVHWLNQAFRNHLYNFGSTVRLPVYLQKALKHVNEAKIRLGNQNASAEQIADQAQLEPGLVSAAMSAVRSHYSLDAELSDSGDGGRLRDLLSAAQPEDGPYSPALEGTTLHQGLDRAMSKLSDRERQVLEMRFGLGREREQTLAEVAAHMGVSVERIRQIQMRAMSKLDTPSLRRELDPWLN